MLLYFHGLSAQVNTNCIAPTPLKVILVLNRIQVNYTHFPRHIHPTVTDSWVVHT